MFKIGDRVRCIDNGGYTDCLVLGEVYVVSGIKRTHKPPNLIYLASLERGVGAVCPYRFELAEDADETNSSLVKQPDPSKPYPNPELEAAKQLQLELIRQRQALRGYLHGTTEDEG